MNNDNIFFYRKMYFLKAEYFNPKNFILLTIKLLKYIRQNPPRNFIKHILQCLNNNQFK